MMQLSLTAFDAVAFDVEGTLANTIPVHHSTRHAAFAQHGFGHITPEQHALGPTYGSSHSDILGGILHAAGVIDKAVPFHENPTVLDIIRTKGELFKEAAAGGFDAMPGAISFVNQIAAHFPNKLALVTSSEEEFVYPFIQRYKMDTYFPSTHVIGHETVTAEDLQVKPSGDPYKLAMKRLNAQRLLVFEDTAPGVAAGKKAGATVIAVAFDAANAKLFEGGELEYPPDAVVHSYEQAASMLGLSGA
jgi:beta-phosphoglucomutase-like phosphatase (HAD superfamily)